MSVSDTKAVLIGSSEASDMNQWSTSVVVVPSGPPANEVLEKGYGHRFGL